MASPISVGDALALAKLALTLGRAFGRGRASAPAEFRDVENQLYSLSAALDALISIIPETTTSDSSLPTQVFQRATRANEADEVEGEDVISYAIRSCEATVKHLESVVTQYAILKKVQNEKPDVSRFKRWEETVKFTWKSIKWTTEGGDLMKLRSVLTVHTNSLNLLLGIKIHARIDQMHRLLRELKSWRSDSLRAPSMEPSTAKLGIGQDLTVRAAVSQTTFALYEASGTQEALVCENAGLAAPNNWTQPEESSMFYCKCPTPGSNTGTSHGERLGTYGFSPLSFCVRIAGDHRVFMAYKVTNKVTTSLTTLLIKATVSQGLIELEEYLLQFLANRQARSLCHRNLSTMLCFRKGDGQTDDRGGGRVHVLNLSGDTTTIPQPVKSVTFTWGDREFRRTAVDTLQLLHYKTMEFERLLEDHFVPETAVQYEPQAEVAIFYASSQTVDDIVQTTLHLTHNTQILVDDAQATITLPKINCTSYDASETAHTKRDVSVVIQHFSGSAAIELYKDLNTMISELFIIHLQYPRAGEVALLKILAKDVYTERFHIADASITMLRNTTTQQGRLLISGTSGHVIVSQELPEDFASTLTTSGQRPSFQNHTFVITMDEKGIRSVRERPEGFSLLDFRDAKVDRLFQIGLATIAGDIEALPDSIMSG